MDFASADAGKMNSGLQSRYILIIDCGHTNFGVLAVLVSNFKVVKKAGRETPARERRIKPGKSATVSPSLPFVG